MKYIWLYRRQRFLNLFINGQNSYVSLFKIRFHLYGYIEFLRRNQSFFLRFLVSFVRSSKDRPLRVGVPFSKTTHGAMAVGSTERENDWRCVQTYWRGKQLTERKSTLTSRWFIACGTTPHALFVFCTCNGVSPTGQFHSFMPTYIKRESYFFLLSLFI